ncbi:MAG: TonB-dependent receptor [Chitinophagaceae bacterium]
MKEKITILIMALGISVFGYAQVSVSGKVVDANGSPVAYSTVEFNKDGKSYGKIADSVGFYALSLSDTGVYKVKVSSFNFRDSIYRIDIADSAVVHDFQLAENGGSTLGNVTVSSNKRKPFMQKKVDRFVFNVAESPIAVGGDAWSVLQHTPLISADNSGKLSIVGNTSASVYINNRKSFLSGADLMNYLQTMPSDNIVSIEVITTPPASYDAGSGGGVINIVLKKILDNGLKGSLTLTDQQATYNRQKASLQLNYKHNRYSQSLTVGGGLGKTFTKFDNTINYFNINQTEIVNEKYITDDKPLSASTSIGYDLSKNSTIGGLVDYSHRRSKSYDYALDDINMNDRLSAYVNNNDGHSSSDMISGNLFYRLVEDKNERSFIVNLDYFNYRSNNDGAFYSRYADSPSEIYNGNMSEAKQKANNYSIKVDYSQQIFKTVTLEIGAKYGYTETKNPYTFYNYSDNDWTYNPQVSNYFVYKEGVTAAYLSLEKKLSSKLDVKAGARIENTDIKTLQQATNESNNQSYTKILPTAYISYAINGVNNLSFAIKNDFERPSFYTLNPFKVYTSNKVIEMGNPFLQPAKIIAYELSYMLKSNYIFTARYQHSSSLFGQIQTIATPDTLLYQQGNYGKSGIWSLISVINQPIIKSKWEINFSNTVQWLKYDIHADQIQSNKTHGLYIGSLNQTFKNLFKTGIEASLFGMYQSNIVNTNLLGKSFGEVDFGLTKNFANAGFKISLYANDIFKTSVYTVHSIGNSSFRSDFRSYYDNRYLRISIIKSFGNKKVKTDQQRSTGNEDEKGRI